MVFKVNIKGKATCLPADDENLELDLVYVSSLIGVMFFSWCFYQEKFFQP